MSNETEKRPLYNILAFEEDLWREFFRAILSVGAGLTAIVVLGTIQAKADEMLTNPQLVKEIEDITNILMAISFFVFEGIAALHVLNMTDRSHSK